MGNGLFQDMILRIGKLKIFQCDKIIYLTEDDKFESISFEKFVNLNSDMYKIHDCNMINFELEV